MHHDPHLAVASTEDVAAWIAARRDAPTAGGSASRGRGRVPSASATPTALQVALAHGWIEGLTRTGHDPGFCVQRVTPRGARGVWSKVNCAHVERLLAAGRVTPRGLGELDLGHGRRPLDAAHSS